MNLTVPDLSLIVLIGVSGSGKSTFAAQHFKPTEVLSSDSCRGLVSDDENDQSVTKDAFEVLHFISRKRLAAGKLTVVDATNVLSDARKPLVALAREYHCIPVAIVLNVPDKLCHERNQQRTNRNFGAHVISQQSQNLRRSLGRLKREGFRHVHILTTQEEIDTTAIVREPLWCNRRNEHGPFDIIGDVHGCCDELEALLHKLGYEVATIEKNDSLVGSDVYQHPQGRKAIFLGDLVDRGPRIVDTIRLISAMVDAGTALCVPGNHDLKLMRKLQGKDVQITHGLDRSLAEIDALPDHLREPFRKTAVVFLDSLTSHYVLDDGNLVVAHAGMKEEMQGRGSGKVRDFALYGETTGETDEFGLPVRYNWAGEYRGTATMVYGHTPVPEPEWLNRTINIDTGCVFGGGLTALRYPEKELVSVAAAFVYCESAKPFLVEDNKAPSLTTQQQHDDILDLDDVIGKRLITTRLHHNVTIREENATAALEVMSRFAVNPKWLIYLPPTMSPCETSQEPGLLEYPAEAFAYFLHHGVPRVVCEEKHMGSRAVIIVCQDEAVAHRRFGVVDEGIGLCYTRTGRRFFGDRQLETELLERIRSALNTTNLWDEFHTDWMCLDCELMPWSAKARELLRQQYAAVGAASQASLPEAVAALEATAGRGVDVAALLERYHNRTVMTSQYIEAYRRYCWPVHTLSDMKLAPFHLMATEGAIHSSKDHVWHMSTLEKLCRLDKEAYSDEAVLLTTCHKEIDLTDAASQQEGIDWWEELTQRGGEGMVIKPFDFINRGPRGLVQPAVKCRGREYLRIIYGPEYTATENLERLRSRSLGAKRSLALREFALGIESLERFVRLEPLRRVHECVFGILALECEPVDPRL